MAVDYGTVAAGFKNQVFVHRLQRYLKNIKTWQFKQVGIAVVMSMQSTACSAENYIGD
jgi:hypothetical protein